MTVSKQHLGQQLAQTLGQTLSEQELSSYLKQIETLELTAGKRFWQTADVDIGIYIIVAGKVRLLDHTEHLLASLEAGDSFGELTLFPEEDFQPHSTRASINLQLCYLNSECLQALIQKHPTIRDHLHHQAVLRDLLLLCRQIATLRNTPLPSLMKMLSLLERHNLNVGNFPVSHWKDQQFWLLRRGELLHSSGQMLTAGNIYAPSQLPDDHTWQVTQPTELYSLNKSHWETVLHHLPELAQLISSDALLEGEGARGRGGELPSLPPTPKKTPSPLTSSLPGVERKKHSKISKAYFPSPTVKVGHWWQRVTRRYSFFEQQSPSDCGVACLVMIGRYWSKRFGVNQLRQIASVDRSGASLRGLTTAAESIGFSTRPVKASLDKLARQSLPAIVHWEGNHYIVVYEISRRHVIVADPAIDQRTLSHAEFQAGWTGYTLLLEPTARLLAAPDSKQPFWQFFELVRPHRLVLFEVLIASIMIQIFGLITPLFTQLLLDRVVVQGSTATLTAVGLGLLFFGLFRVMMNGLRQYLLYQTANRVDLALIVGFISHIFRLPLNFFESRYVGDITSRVDENYKIRSFLTGEALTTLLDLLTVFVYVGMMFWYSWQMALLALLIVPPFVSLAVIATPFLQRISREIFNAKTAESSYLIEGITGMSTVKSMGIERTVRWHWEELFYKYVKVTFSGQIIGNTLQLFSSTIEVVVSRTLLWLGAWQVIHNQLTIGQLVAFNMLLGNLINPFKRLISLWNQFQEVVIAVERINDVIDAKAEEDLQIQFRPSLPRIYGHIRFGQVTFRYKPESDINTLENLSFEVQPGQTVAIVGRSGSGKTTIAKLILALYSVTDGKVLVDGHDVASISLLSLRQQIGVVDQNTFLFGGTIYENISIGHPEATLEDIVETARLSGADQFIKDLALGYETQIGEGGGMLSGGQRQRLAIARALLGNPQLLILDEATSSLDAESERIIQTNLNTILKNRTTLVIAHRLSTVRNADKILVLDRGVLVESGTHDELMTRRGQYFYLNQQQLAFTG